MLPTEFQEFLRMGQGANGGLHLTETTVKPFFQLGHGDIGRVLVVENFERQTEFCPKLFQRHFVTARLRQHEI